MKKLFAFCLIAILMIAFAPPGSCSSPPIQQDKVYVIDQPATVNAPVQVAIEIMYADAFFVSQNESLYFGTVEAQLSPGYGLVCGFARNWPGLNDLSYIKLSEPTEQNMRTCSNSMRVTNKATLSKRVIHYQPRDGLTTAAA